MMLWDGSLQLEIRTKSKHFPKLFPASVVIPLQDFIFAQKKLADTLVFKL